MSVYVDGLIIWGGDDAPRCFRNKPSCHMFADTLEELHSLAAQIGLKSSWFQDNKRLQHYDLTESKRKLAVRYGAIEVTDRTKLVELWQKLRASRSTTA